MPATNRDAIFQKQSNLVLPFAKLGKEHRKSKEVDQLKCKDKESTFINN